MSLDLLSTPSTIELLSKLRQTGSVLQDELEKLSANDRAYFEAEIAIRKVAYEGLEAKIPATASAWLKNLCICYRDLFSNPKRALESINSLIEDAPKIHHLQFRLKVWRAHLLLLTGDVARGDRSLTRLKSILPQGDYLWRTEFFVVAALGHYFAGRTSESLVAHSECQRELDKSPDLFFQTFNSAMATRVALKRCDADAFEYFSKKLEAALIIENDSRFRLRHAAYRALILNQIGEHEASDQHWASGDLMIHQTESSLEQGHYYLYRGLSCAIRGHHEPAIEFYGKSFECFKKVGSPPNFISELDIAEKLVYLSNPAARGAHALRTCEIGKKLLSEFALKAEEHEGINRLMYKDASQFCYEILNGEIPNERTHEFTSVTLSIIDNVYRSRTFAKGLSHFRLVPNFIAAVKQTGITEAGVANALQNVLRVNPIYSEERYLLPKEMITLANSPEIKNVLEFASTLCELGKNADKLFEVEARLKEGQRANYLLHDLRYFSMELSQLAQGQSHVDEFSHFAIRFNELIENYLTTIRTGVAPDAPGLVSIRRLLENVASVSETFGKKFKVQGKVNSFVWTSEPLLQRILLNLIKNGLEAGHGECPVEVNIVQDNDNLSIHVKDNGTGIPISVLESLADTSKETATTTKQDGTGLGLRSAFECANLIKADIVLVSTNENGSHFEVCLRTPFLSQTIHRNTEILVIDDCQSVLDAWIEFGFANSLRIDAVSPSNAAPILNNVPKLLKWIVLDYDLKLPNTNGARLAESMKALGVKVALSTGFQPDELPQDARAITWDALFGKEPQSPDRAIPFIKPEQSETKEINLALKALRHDIRNELTPLKSIYQFVRNRRDIIDEKSIRYVNLFGKSLDSIEMILEKNRNDSTGGSTQWTQN